MNFLTYFKDHFAQKLSADVTVKYRHDRAGIDGYDNNLGDYFGVDLESSTHAGNLIFWSKGYLDFMVITIESLEEVVPTKMLEVSDYQNQEKVIMKVISYFC